MAKGGAHAGQREQGGAWGGGSCSTYSVHDEGGVLVGCGPRGLEAAPLVDGHVHDDGALLHEGEHLARDELGGLGAWDQDAPDNEVCRLACFADVVLVAVERAYVWREYVVKLAETRKVDVHDCHPRPEAGSYLCCLCPDDTTTKDQNFGRFDSGDTAKKNSPAAHRFFKIFCTCKTTDWFQILKNTAI